MIQKSFTSILETIYILYVQIIWQGFFNFFEKPDYAAELGVISNDRSMNFLVS